MRRMAMQIVQVILLHVFQSMACFTEFVRRQLVPEEAYEVKEPGL